MDRSAFAGIRVLFWHGPFRRMDLRRGLDSCIDGLVCIDVQRVSPSHRDARRGVRGASPQPWDAFPRRDKAPAHSIANRPRPRRTGVCNPAANDVRTPQQNPEQQNRIPQIGPPEPIGRALNSGNLRKSNGFPTSGDWHPTIGRHPPDDPDQSHFGSGTTSQKRSGPTDHPLGKPINQGASQSDRL